jgi:hypothetical protein
VKYVEPSSRSKRDKLSYLVNVSVSHASAHGKVSLQDFSASRACLSGSSRKEE